MAILKRTKKDDDDDDYDDNDNDDIMMMMTTMRRRRCMPQFPTYQSNNFATPSTGVSHSFVMYDVVTAYPRSSLRIGSRSQVSPGKVLWACLRR